MAKGRYENVGIKQTSCEASVTSDRATSLTLDIAKDRDAVEMSKIAGRYSVGYLRFVLIPRGLLCT